MDTTITSRPMKHSKVKARLNKDSIMTLDIGNFNAQGKDKLYEIVGAVIRQGKETVVDWFKYHGLDISSSIDRVKYIALNTSLLADSSERLMGWIIQEIPNGGIEYATLTCLRPIDVAVMAQHILGFHISVQSVVSDFIEMRISFYLHADIVFYFQLCMLAAQRNQLLKEQGMSGINWHENEVMVACSSCGEKANLAFSDGDGRRYRCEHCHAITTHLVDFPGYIRTPIKIFHDVYEEYSPFSLEKFDRSLIVQY